MRVNIVGLMIKQDLSTAMNMTIVLSIRRINWSRFVRFYVVNKRRMQSCSAYAVIIIYG